MNDVRSRLVKEFTDINEALYKSAMEKDVALAQWVRSRTKEIEIALAMYDTTMNRAHALMDLVDGT